MAEMGHGPALLSRRVGGSFRSCSPGKADRPVSVQLGDLRRAHGNGRGAPNPTVRRLTPGPQGIDPKAAVPACALRDWYCVLDAAAIGPRSYRVVLCFRAVVAA